MNNSTIVEPSYSFIDSDITKGALVFLDEFDACKDAILNHQIEEAAKNAVGNVFGLIKKIGDSFDSPMTEDFFAGEPESNGHNAAYVYEEIKKKFHAALQYGLSNATLIYQADPIQGKNIIVNVLETFSVWFVKLDSFTVLPYPFKYLREYALMDIYATGRWKEKLAAKKNG